MVMKAKTNKQDKTKQNKKKKRKKRLHAQNYLLEGRSVLGPKLSSAAQLCLILWDTTDCRMSGFPIHHQHPELAQTHVHRVGKAIQPSHPLLPSSPPTSNHSQHQGPFK